MRWRRAGELAAALAAAVAFGIGLRQVIDPEDWADWMTASSKKDDDEPDDFHWEARLSGAERALICDALRALKTDLSALRTGALTQIQLARRMPGPKRELIDWDAGEKEIAKRGSRWSLADLAEEGR